MFDYLNSDVVNLIMDFTDYTNFWKRRFTFDVLPYIDKGYRMVYFNDLGVCWNCYHYTCPCSNNCNQYNNNNCKIIDYNEYKQDCKVKYEYYLEYKNKDNYFSERDSIHEELLKKIKIYN